MKNLILITTVLFASISQAAVSKLKPQDVIGKYEMSASTCTESETQRPCVGAEIIQSGKNLIVALSDYDMSANLVLNKQARYVFKWTNPEEEQCDDPGCSNLISISGVVYTKTVDGKNVTKLKIFVENEYPYPEYEGDNEGFKKIEESFTKR